MRSAKIIPVILFLLAVCPPQRTGVSAGSAIVGVFNPWAGHDRNSIGWAQPTTHGRTFNHLA